MVATLIVLSVGALGGIGGAIVTAWFLEDQQAKHTRILRRIRPA